MEKEGPSFNPDQSYDEFREFIRRHRILKNAVSTITWAMILATLPFTSLGKEIFSSPLYRKILFDRDLQVGLLEGSILNYQLYHPNEQKTSLELNQAPAGRYVGYDFHRTTEFPRKDFIHQRQNPVGRLCLLDLNEVKDKNPNEYTPTSISNLFDIDHLLSIKVITPDEGINKGFIKQTTYEQAYKEAGYYHKYKLYLTLNHLNDTPVYVVTPKGNSLVDLTPDFGEKKPKTKQSFELKPVLQT